MMRSTGSIKSLGKLLWSAQKSILPSGIVLARNFSSSKFSKIPGADQNDMSSILKAKEEARTVLKEQSEAMEAGVLTVDEIMKRIIELKSVKDIQDKIAFAKKPIIIFAMAKWCNTSKQLLPSILEKYSAEHELWDLALLDIDVDAKLTATLKIDKVPCVMLAYQGNIVDGFKGLVAQSEIQRFFETVTKVGKAYQANAGVEQVMNDILTAYEGGQWKTVLEKVALIKQAPMHPPMKRLISLFEVSSLIKNKDVGKGKALWELLQNEKLTPGTEEVWGYISQIEEGIRNFFEKAETQTKDKRADLLNELESVTGDNDLLFALAGKSAESEVYDIALESLYRIIKKDKNWSEKKAYNKYIELLKHPSIDKALVKNYRLKLGSIIA